MSKRDDIDFGRLADWVEGRLSEEEADAVAGRIAEGDEETRARAEWLRAFVQASGEIQFSPPPRGVRETLSRRFASQAEAAREPGVLPRIVASLSFDSGLDLAAAGTRTAGAQEERQLAFTTDVAEVVLDVMPRPGGKSLDLGGQIFPSGEESPDNFTIQLLRDGTEKGMTASDELGEFAFEDVPYGEYELVLGTRQVEVLIPRFELSP